jgi:hypothetical protein
MTLPIVGAFSELWPRWRGVELPSIRDAVSDRPEPDEDELAEYLRGGQKLMVFMGVTEDLFGSGEQFFGHNIMTDGSWVWRESMCFYVRRYHVRLPSEFVEAVRAVDYRRPEVGAERARALVEQVRPLLR